MLLKGKTVQWNKWYLETLSTLLSVQFFCKLKTTLENVYQNFKKQIHSSMVGLFLHSHFCWSMYLSCVSTIAVTL